MSEGLTDDRNRCPFVTAADMQCRLYEGHPDGHDLGILAGAVCICGSANPEHHYRWCPTLPLTHNWLYPLPGNDFRGRLERLMEQNMDRLSREYDQARQWFKDGDQDALAEHLGRDNKQRAQIMAARARGEDAW